MPDPSPVSPLSFRGRLRNQKNSTRREPAYWCQNKGCNGKPFVHLQNYRNHIDKYHAYQPTQDLSQMGSSSGIQQTGTAFNLAARQSYPGQDIVQPDKAAASTSDPFQCTNGKSGYDPAASELAAQQLIVLGNETYDNNMFLVGARALLPYEILPNDSCNCRPFPQ
jgi:hypothetical protein